jgi:hypothetical protein
MKAAILFLLRSMNETAWDVIKFLSTGLIAVFGWIIGHYFTSKRDITNKRRELTIQHLIGAYRILTNEISHRVLTNDTRTKLESIVTEIQLFGSEEQVNLVKKLANDVASGKEYELDPLINSLRRDLRKQLDLKEVESNVTWLRFTPGKKYL